MKLTTNHLILKKGDIVEVSWDTGELTEPKLSITVSGRESIMDIEPVGNKKFRLNGTTMVNRICVIAKDTKGRIRKKGRIVFTVGKRDSGEEKYDSYSRVSPPWKERIRQYFEMVRNNWKYAPRERKRLYVILVILMMYLTFAETHPQIAHVIILGAIGYIIYILFKRNY